MAKDDYLKRLRRIEGQVRGLQRMIEEDTYCIDVLTQVSRTRRAWQSVGLGFLDEHLHYCATEAVAAGGPEGTAKVDEATAAIRRLVRSRHAPSTSPRGADSPPHARPARR